jgi:hypothetical protein
MSTHFDLIERRRSGKIITKKKPLSIEVKKSLYMLIFALLGIIVVLSIVFLLNTSQSSQKGYVLKQQELKKEALMLQNHELVNKIIDVMTYQKVEDNPIIKGMIKPENLQYIKLPKPVVPVE